MNAIDLLKTEHRDAEKKFDAIEDAAPKQRGELWKELKPELKVHEHIEDEFLYGPLSRDPKAKGTPLADFQQHQDKDVAELDKAIAKLERNDPTDAAWLTQLKAIRASLAEHIKEEETKILPAIPKVWSPAQLEKAGTAMKEEKQRKLKTIPAG